MTTLGIIGQGNFGKFVAQQLDGFFKVETYDVGNADMQLARVAKCDFVALAIPLGAYHQLLPKLAKVLGRDSVIVDLCSVKIKPLELLAKYLPGKEVLAIHTLFGPSTTANGIKGQKIIICRDTGSFQLHVQAQKFFEHLGLEIIQMDADKHDQMMAELQALTYFVAESLADFGVSEHPISLPSYGRLVSLLNITNTLSEDVLTTIEQGNPYAQKVRTKLMQSFAKINNKYSANDSSDDTNAGGAE